MKIVEVAPNIFITNTLVDKIEDPASMVDDLEGLNQRVVGGLHNLSTHDKVSLATQGPIRLIERGTKREEIWFPGSREGVVHISIDSETGMIQSHEKYGRPMPAVEFRKREPMTPSSLWLGEARIQMWYNEGLLHAFDNTFAITSDSLSTKPQDKKVTDYIDHVKLYRYKEAWRDGEWTETEVEDVGIGFQNKELNDPAVQIRAIQWIRKHCKHGFFPLSEQLFGDEEEEFLFIADVCSS